MMLSRLLRKLFGRSRPPNPDSGEWGEVQAEKYLRSKGLRILGRRVRHGNREEIDLVARDKDVLVFVEVKTRAGQAYGRPIESVDRRKRQLLCRAAARYLARLRNPRVCFRFDVVEILGCPATGVANLVHTPNAFPMDRRYSI